MPTLAEVVAALEHRYDPAWAAGWDCVGLTSGDPAAAVRRVHLAVDCVAETVAEAIAVGADLLLTHHPLLLHGVHSVAATSAKGRLLRLLITHDVALFAAHTNADVADPGVSDALASAVRLRDVRPLVADVADPLDKVVTFVPHADAQRVLDALADAGAGEIGDYSRCAWTAVGTGTFLPGAGARPVIGTVGTVEQVPETRVEMVLARHRRVAVLAALRAAHPYEEPAWDLFELAAVPGRRGAGRIGELAEEMTLADFTAMAAAALPATAVGLRAAGDPQRVVRTVAVSGGAGDSYLADATRAGVDAYLTADLRHHPASEHLADGGPALIDATHFATEWPWLGQAAALLVDDLAGAVTATVSSLVTDPWTVHRASRPVDTVGHRSTSAT